MFCRFLQRELETGRELLQIIEQEHELLIQGDPEEIETTSERKRQQVQELQHRVAERDRFLARQDLPNGKEGVENLLQQVPSNSPASRYWEELQALAAMLHRRNEITGGILALGQRHIRQALDILTGQMGAKLTYGPEGVQRSGYHARSLVKV
jgi:flagella synthesis protein FlgN